jgi:hypothetical protein
MPLALIGKIKANNTNDSNGQYPYTDANAQIVLDADDGNSPVTVTVDSVNPLHLSLGKALTEFNGGFNTARKMAWTVTLTDRRILYWAPELAGAFGGVKPGGGKAATAGHMAYGQLASINVCNDPDYSSNTEGHPDICIEAYHYSGSTTQCYIEADVATLRKLLGELAKRYSAFMENKGSWSAESESSLKKLAGFDWEGGKGITFLDLAASPARLESKGAPQFNE